MHYQPTTRTQSLYVHWPFCPYKCHYCPFVALAGHDSFMEQYHEALIREIALFADTRVYNDPLDTVYFGGGDPKYLSE